MPQNQLPLIDLFSTELKRSIKRKRTILFQGEIPRSVHIIEKGCIRSYTLDNYGVEHTIAFYGVGDIVPTSWTFKISPVSLHYYEAHTDCVLISVARDAFIQALESDTALMAKAMQHLAKLLVASTLHIRALEQGRAREKLLHLLYFLSLRFGKEVKNNLCAITIDLTQEDLAALLGVARETVAIELGKLKRANLVTYRHKEYVIDVEKIRIKIGEEPSEVEF